MRKSTYLIWEDIIHTHQSGDIYHTRRLLHQAAEQKPSDPLPWLWLARLAENPLSEYEYLCQAERIDPKNLNIRAVRQRVQKRNQQISSRGINWERDKTIDLPVPELAHFTLEGLSPLEYQEYFGSVLPQDANVSPPVPSQDERTTFAGSSFKLNPTPEPVGQGGVIYFSQPPRFSLTWPGWQDTLLKEFLVTSLAWISLMVLISLQSSPPFLAPAKQLLGLSFFLVFPGYWLMVALFPRRGEFKPVQRLIVAIGLSLTLLPFLAIILNFTPWGIRYWSIFYSLSLIVFLSFLAAWSRRKKNFPNKQASFPAQKRKWSWTILRETIARKTILISLCFLSLTMVFFLFVIELPQPAENVSEFHLLHDADLAYSYPWVGQLGEPRVVMLSITNKENQPAQYRIEVRSEDQVIGFAGPLKLSPGENQVEKVTFTPSQVGNNRPVYFHLYKDDADIPFRSLRVWLNISRSIP